jgi:hypothetical protein
VLGGATDLAWGHVISFSEMEMARVEGLKTFVRA